MKESIVYISMIFLLMPCSINAERIFKANQEYSIKSNIAKSYSYFDTVLIGKFCVDTVEPFEKINNAQLTFSVEQVIKGEINKKKINFEFLVDVYGRFESKNQKQLEDVLEKEDEILDFEIDHYQKGDVWFNDYENNLLEKEKGKLLEFAADKEHGNNYFLSAPVMVPFGA